MHYSLVLSFDQHIRTICDRVSHAIGMGSSGGVLRDACGLAAAHVNDNSGVHNERCHQPRRRRGLPASTRRPPMQRRDSELFELFICLFAFILSINRKKSMIKEEKTSINQEESSNHTNRRRYHVFLAITAAAATSSRTRA
ncbi:hypothetical protein D1007_48443 [Hordeum vulgare]|nr:hypothetical protein D1007_48443 [Hordeum vulgare]